MKRVTVERYKEDVMAIEQETKDSFTYIYGRTVRVTRCYSTTLIEVFPEKDRGKPCTVMTGEIDLKVIGDNLNVHIKEVKP